MPRQRADPQTAAVGIAHVEGNTTTLGDLRHTFVVIRVRAAVHWFLADERLNDGPRCSDSQREVRASFHSQCKSSARYSRRITANRSC